MPEPDERGERAGRKARHSEKECFFHDENCDFGVSGTEGNSNPNLARAFGDAKGRDTKYADQREDECEPAKQSKQRNNRAAHRDRL
jgi:hypothetical protein